MRLSIIDSDMSRVFLLDLVVKSSGLDRLHCPSTVLTARLHLHLLLGETVVVIVSFFVDFFRYRFFNVDSNGGWRSRDDAFFRVGEGRVVVSSFSRTVWGCGGGDGRD